MDTSHEMVLASFKYTFKLADNYNSLEAKVAVFINEGETKEQAFKRAWDLVQKQVFEQVRDTMNSFRGVE